MIEDPLVRSSRREAMFSLGLWGAALAYTVSYCYLHGYNRDPAEIKFLLWFPDWVFWGIVVPWVACAVISSVFALFFMGNESLGVEQPPEDNADNFLSNAQRSQAAEGTHGS